jgi:hypothetical protein
VAWAEAKDNWLPLTESILSLATPGSAADSGEISPDLLENKNLRRCLKLVQLARNSDAVQALLSNGVASVTDEVYEELKAKHPQTPPLSASDLPSGPPPASHQASSEDVRRAIESFSKGSAPGLFHLRPDHLREALAPRNPHQAQAFLTAITAFSNTLLAGHIPEEVVPFFMGAPVIALNKPNNGGVRPIAVGECLRRLVGKVAAFHARDKIQGLFAGRQFGVGLPNGADAIIHATQSVVDALGHSSSFGLLQIDFTNAFNLVSRQVFLEEVRAHLPELAAWAEVNYSHQAHLFAGGRHFWSCQGPQQGDPCGPLFFSLAHFRLVKHIDAELGELLLHCWYLDDGVFIGPHWALRRIIEIIQERGPALGLQINLKKSSLWWPTIDQAEWSLYPPDLKKIRDQDGIILLGGPVGGPVSAATLVHSRVDKIEKLCGFLPKLDSSQVALTLLRSCVGFPRIAFALRTCIPSYAMDEYRRFDELMQKSLSHIVGCPVTPDALLQASLPPSLGGLGITSAELIAPAAYVASCFQSLGLQRLILKPLGPGPLGICLPRPEVVSLLDSLNDAMRSNFG